MIKTVMIADADDSDEGEDDDRDAGGWCWWIFMSNEFPEALSTIGWKYDVSWLITTNAKP